MKNPIKAVKEYVNDKNKKLDEVLRQKEEKLKELENTAEKTGYGLLHPVKSKKNKKEIEELKKEISDVEKKKKINKFAPPVIAAVAVFGIIGLIASPKNGKKSEYTPERYAVTETVTEAVTEKETEPETTAEAETEAEITTAEEVTEKVTESSAEESLAVIEPVTEKQETELVRDYEPEPITEPATSAPPVTEPVTTSPPADVVVPVEGHGTVSLAPGTIVWKSATGAKFHNNNSCGRMDASKAIQITVEEAVGIYGLSACEKCYG